jgi:hypothetical protein
MIMLNLLSSPSVVVKFVFTVADDVNNAML